ncbi:LysR substrate-binding domain-containing protein [Pseudomonas sp. NPDC089996]|uniref:LysR family transcriptional regulator n=1 Tax=Pseudomonas sp. NPDC089996 TaxID=3364474 RepID=UPI003808CA8A
MEFRQLKQVLVLAETLNFHRAAEQLNMTQPPLSTSIKKLEEELGVLLFERLPSGLRLTQAGDAVLRNARSALFFAEEMRRAAHEAEVGERGRLRVGFVGSAAYGLLPKIIRSFREQYPQVELELEEGVGHVLLERIEAHELDVALVRHPQLRSGAAQLTLLKEECMALAVSSDSPLAAETSVRFADLSDLPFIISSQSRSPSLHAQVLMAFQEAGIQPPIVQQAAQLTTALGLVESGLGVSLIPESAARYVGPNIRVLALSDQPQPLRSGIALASLAQASTSVLDNFRRHAVQAAQA